MNILKKKSFWFCTGFLFLLLCWEALSRLYGKTLIFPGPVRVFKELIKIFSDPVFYKSLHGTFLRVMAGILISVPPGCLLGIIAGLDKRASAFLQPFFSLVAATPVLSVILIFFLILGAEKTPVLTAFLMIFPVMSQSCAGGMGSIDPLLKEMAKSFNFTFKEKLIFLYIPELTPFILGGLKSGLSLAWKVIIAAEVIVQPLRSFGWGMQSAKNRLDTPMLFAWTIAAVAAAALTQGLLSLAVFLLFENKNKREPK